MSFFNFFSSKSQCIYSCLHFIKSHLFSCFLFFITTVTTLTHTHTHTNMSSGHVVTNAGNERRSHADRMSVLSGRRLTSGIIKDQLPPQRSHCIPLECRNERERVLCRFLMCTTVLSRISLHFCSYISSTHISIVFSL